MTNPENAGLSGKIIPAQLVRMHGPAKAKTAPPRQVPALACSRDKAGEPRITLVKDGDTVRAIEIECTCGERIRLECEY